MTVEARDPEKPIIFKEVKLYSNDKQIYLYTFEQLNLRGIRTPLFGGAKDSNNRAKFILLVEEGDFPEFDEVVKQALILREKVSMVLLNPFLEEPGLRNQHVNPIVNAAIDMAIEVLDKSSKS